MNVRRQAEYCSTDRRHGRIHGHSSAGQRFRGDLGGSGRRMTAPSLFPFHAGPGVQEAHAPVTQRGAGAELLPGVAGLAGGGCTASAPRLFRAEDAARAAVGGEGGGQFWGQRNFHAAKYGAALGLVVRNNREVLR